MSIHENESRENESPSSSGIGSTDRSGAFPELMHDRGRGPEIKGTRYTVYDLLPYFLDASLTEQWISNFCKLTPQQVAAARSYILRNPEAVIEQHLRLEERAEVGNDPKFAADLEKTRATMRKFKEWLAREDAELPDRPLESPSDSPSGVIQSFREWLEQQETAVG
ncbi:MAG: hypothetical protein JO161_04140, partial [Planctomycetaceae bacterium]|nr:hypothetical protein [Planctomycetaceae bacterium]